MWWGNIKMVTHLWPYRIHLSMQSHILGNTQRVQLGKTSEDGMWLAMWQDNKTNKNKQSQMQSSHPMKCLSQCTDAYTGLPTECSSGVCYSKKWCSPPEAVRSSAIEEQSQHPAQQLSTHTSNKSITAHAKHFKNNNVHLSCAHQCPERSHDTY